MIHFSVERAADDDTRTLYLEGTQTLVGWLESGRLMVDFSGKRWTEWAFVPADESVPRQSLSIRESLSAAYEDARRYAEYRQERGSRF